MPVEGENAGFSVHAHLFGGGGIEVVVDLDNGIDVFEDAWSR